MMNLHASVIVVALGLGMQASLAAPADDKRTIPTAGQLREFLKIYLSTIYTRPANCLDPSKHFCVVDVSVQIVQFKGTDGVDRDYCLAEYPEVINVRIPS